MKESDLYGFYCPRFGEEEYVITFEGENLFFLRNVTETAVQRIVAALNGARLLGIAEGERRTLEAWQNVDIERSSRL